MSLPTIRVSIDCGSCGDSLEHDCDQYVCRDCGLCWATNDVFDDSPATYLDEEAQPCSAPSKDTETVQVKPFRTVNGVVEVWRTWRHVYAPCALPAGHMSDHEFPLSTTYTDHEEKP
ncbi:hypothetical protein [Pseudarthrobacter sp. NIBRBAC000502770]|uniref:hypothetical protein n=1 Tax=Pseudarthrobacter sp. NIBRBAC000502770 TaxID=2590785 RepID=UPI001140464D|nr:hypothetical protein [Pseudarthrobacter sp. NIBRBAC000502770]QDG87135.1 hypothetical protein NIBR502770_00460 [Pseudarthrobacter sp. NIBRBAC000502770]